MKKLLITALIFLATLPAMAIGLPTNAYVQREMASKTSMSQELAKKATFEAALPQVDLTAKPEATPQEDNEDFDLKSLSFADYLIGLLALAFQFLVRAK